MSAMGARCAHGIRQRDERTGCAHGMRAQNVRTESAHGMHIPAAGIPAACEQRIRVPPFLRARQSLDAFDRARAVRQRMGRSYVATHCSLPPGSFAGLCSSSPPPQSPPSPSRVAPPRSGPRGKFPVRLGPSQSGSCPLSRPNLGRLWCAGSRARWVPSTTTRASLTRWPVATPKPCAASSSAVQQRRADPCARFWVIWESGRPVAEVAGNLGLALSACH
jgi:hypothetical protein